MYSLCLQNTAPNTIVESFFEGEKSNVKNHANVSKQGQGEFERNKSEKVSNHKKW